MRIYGEDLETALELWHPEQYVYVYDTLLGVHLYDSKIKHIDPEEEMCFSFAEAIDEETGQPCKPRLKDS